MVLLEVLNFGSLWPYTFCSFKLNVHLRIFLLSSLLFLCLLTFSDWLGEQNEFQTTHRETKT